jgi:hypothetical protein
VASAAAGGGAPSRPPGAALASSRPSAPGGRAAPRPRHAPARRRPLRGCVLGGVARTAAAHPRLRDRSRSETPVRNIACCSVGARGRTLLTIAAPAARSGATAAVAPLAARLASPPRKQHPTRFRKDVPVETKQFVPLVGLVALAVVLRVLAEPTGELVGCVVGGLLAAVWIDRVSPGHRSSRLGRPRWSWLWPIAAPSVTQLLLWPLMGNATLGVCTAVFLGGLMRVSAQNDYGRAT